MTHEKIRLVIWDLDDTFWSGTVTEGGHLYNRQAHDIVVELARRGIISSICSKNEFAVIRSILEAEGIWDYFVFPSINWEPKGPRIARIIEDMQLRPATVLFIDDNHLNRSEAAFFVPDLQVQDETCIPHLLQNPLLAGKDDRELTRLKQYRLLQTRKAEEQAAEGDNIGFLRQSGIEVTLDYDVEGNLDRAIELVNRTNQLNFTKARLPEDMEAARASLREIVSKYDIQAGLVHVKDRYGDYGICGFFCVKIGARTSRLLHFCFSCRILNMGVEAWVFNKLGRPDLTVVGEVLTDIHAEGKQKPDWINAARATMADMSAQGVRIGQVIAFGGCNISSLARYFLVTGADVITEVPYARNGVPVIRDHSMMLRFAALGLSHDEARELISIGYDPEDWSSALFRPQKENPVWLLSFWPDAGAALYRHKKLGFAVPLAMKFLPAGCRDVRLADPVHLPQTMQTPWAHEMVRKLRDEYEWAGPTTEADFARNIGLLMDQAPADAAVFVLLNIEFVADSEGVRKVAPFKVEANERLRRAFAPYPNAELIDVMAFVRSDAEIDKNPTHLHRDVYYRVYKHIMGRIEARQGKEGLLF